MLKKKSRKKRQKVFGQELILDLYNCNLKTMQSKKKIQEFCKKICKLIGINRIGSAIIKKTGRGELKGYSVCQFLETSSIIIHTCDPILETHIDIFSCILFSNEKAVSFAKKFFRAKKIKKIVLMR